MTVEAVTLEDLCAQEGLRLGRSSSSGWKSGKCPFHEDRNDSFGVNFDLGAFKCHAASCGVSGSAVDWLIAKGYSKKEALDLVKPLEDSTKKNGSGHKVQRIETVYHYIGPKGARKQTRYEPGFPRSDGTLPHRDYRWDKKSKISPRLLVHPAKPDGKELRPDTLVFAEGGPAADAIGRAGFVAAGLSSATPPDKSVIEWIWRETRPNWVLWPDNDDGGKELMNAVARMAPPKAKVFMVDPPENLGEAGDAANCTIQQIRHAVHFSQKPSAKKLAPKPKRPAPAPAASGDFILTKSNLPVRNSSHNAEVLLKRLDLDIRYDEFSDSCRVFGAGCADGGERMADRHWHSMVREADRRFLFHPVMESFRSYILDIAWQHRFHPVRDYLKACPKPKDRKAAIEEISMMATQGFSIPGDDKAGIAAIRKWLCAAVRRVRIPGAQWKYVLVLVADQNSRKSDALSKLCPTDEWFVDKFNFNMSDQQIAETVQGAWVIECAELQGMARAGIEAVKAHLSSRFDKVRRAYGREVEWRYRQCVFAASSDKRSFLRDTQNVRWWPVELNGQTDPDYIAKHRDAMWGAASVLEPNEKLWMDDPEIAKSMLARQTKVAHRDDWLDLLADVNCDERTTHEILDQIKVDRTKRNEMRLAKILIEQMRYTRSKRHSRINADGERKRVSVWMAPKGDESDPPF